MLEYLTAGESHGKGLLAILEGFPAGVKIDEAFINAELKARQSGYGRGGRMAIESDRVEIWSGIRGEETIGAPIGLLIKNRDCRIEDLPPVTAPRPGHADLAGAMKFGFSDARNVLERASARETASRVALGALAQIMLREFGIEVLSRVVSIGGIAARTDLGAEGEKHRKESLLNCPDPIAEKKMIERIEEAKKSGDTLGGVFQVVARAIPPGLGSYTQADRRLDARLSAALMSIPAIKAVGIGLGFSAASSPGSEVHDEIVCTEKGLCRLTNRAGGIEGGLSNGEEIVLLAAMKPIPTLMKPLQTVDLKTGQAASAAQERSDVCAVPAASVVGRNVAALVLAEAFLEKFGGDSLAEIRRNFSGYMESLKKY
jgi:chorismate synthase